MTHAQFYHLSHPVSALLERLSLLLCRDGSRLVSADTHGKLYFWRLPQDLHTATIQEKLAFQNIPYQAE